MQAYSAKYSFVGNIQPSHVVLFGATLQLGVMDQPSDGPTIKDRLEDMGYKEVWYGWGIMDQFHPESHKRGGVRVWTTDNAVKPIS